MTTDRRPYRTDLSDARWALIEAMLLAWRAQRVGLGIAKIQHDLREIVNAILYVNRTGIAWEYLPHDFPPYKTVHGYFALWEKEGITEAIHDALRGKVRRAAGRSPEPTAVILDAQTVKTSGNVPEHSQGIDAGNYLGSPVISCFAATRRLRRRPKRSHAIDRGRFDLGGLPKISPRSGFCGAW